MSDQVSRLQRVHDYVGHKCKTYGSWDDRAVRQWMAEADRLYSSLEHLEHVPASTPFRPLIDLKERHSWAGD